MRFTSHAVTKLDYARYLVACLAYLARKQRDRVGLITFDDDVVDFVPPSAKHLPILLHTLDRADRGDEVIGYVIADDGPGIDPVWVRQLTSSPARMANDTS